MHNRRPGNNKNLLAAIADFLETASDVLDRRSLRFFSGNITQHESESVLF